MKEIKHNPSESLGGLRDDPRVPDTRVIPQPCHLKTSLFLIRQYNVFKTEFSIRNIKSSQQFNPRFSLKNISCGPFAPLGKCIIKYNIEDLET